MHEADIKNLNTLEQASLLLLRFFYCHLDYLNEFLVLCRSIHKSSGVCCFY